MNEWPWLPPPRRAQRPPQLQDQLGWVLGLVAGVTVLVDILLALGLLGRLWGETAGSRNAILCGAAPLNLLSLTVLGLWFWKRRRRRR